MFEFQLHASTNLGTGSVYAPAPQGVWQQADHPGLWTQAVITVIASNGCVRQTTYRPLTSTTASRYDEWTSCP